MKQITHYEFTFYFGLALKRRKLFIATLNASRLRQSPEMSLVSDRNIGAVPSGLTTGNSPA